MEFGAGLMAVTFNFLENPYANLVVIVPRRNLSSSY